MLYFCHHILEDMVYASSFYFYAFFYFAGQAKRDMVRDTEK